MKAAKWIILIVLLLVLLLGGMLLDPLVRFNVDLQLKRIDDAATVYAEKLCASDRLSQEADRQLHKYLNRQLNRYYKGKTAYAEIRDIIASLSTTELPHTDIDSCRRAVAEMEAARSDYAQANAFYDIEDYAHAIPLYRQSLIADPSASFRLMQAEIGRKNQLLDQAEQDMAAGRLEDAQELLLEGLSLLGADEDLSAALADVRRLTAEKAYDALIEEARRLLTEEGPAEAFRFMEDSRPQIENDYAFEYVEQLIRHEYEADICEQAASLRDAGNAAGACSLLEEGLLAVESDAMRSLLYEIRTTICVWLTDLPVLRDETSDPKDEKKSTVRRDQVLTDSFSNEYSHSFSADAGSISFDLQGVFAVFTGTVAFPKGETSDIYRESATLKIFGDGRLLAEFKDIGGDAAPLPFSIPVDGVNELTLRWTSEGANGWKDWGRFAAIFDGRFLYPGAKEQ